MSLYFRQLLAGRDFGRDAAFAAQMENFVYLIGDKDTGECVVVDPAWAIDDLVAVAAADDMRITGALVTHYHPDHIGGDIFGIHIEGLPRLMEVAPCPVHVHRLEAHGVRAVTGLSATDLVLHDSGDVVQVGKVGVELLHTPGHTPGSLCFRVKDALVSGDTLFLQGCGRVDLPGGDADELFRSLTKLRALPGETVLYPGHRYGGANAPMHAIVESNPMMQVRELARFRMMMG